MDFLGRDHVNRSSRDIRILLSSPQDRAMHLPPKSQLPILCSLHRTSLSKTTPSAVHNRDTTEDTGLLLRSSLGIGLWGKTSISLCCVYTAHQLLRKRNNCNVKSLLNRNEESALRRLRPRTARNVNIRGVYGSHPITRAPGSLHTYQALKDATAPLHHHWKRTTSAFTTADTLEPYEAQNDTECRPMQAWRWVSSLARSLSSNNMTRPREPRQQYTSFPLP